MVKYATIAALSIFGGVLSAGTFAFTAPSTNFRVWRVQGGHKRAFPSNAYQLSRKYSRRCVPPSSARINNDDESGRESNELSVGPGNAQCGSSSIANTLATVPERLAQSSALARSLFLSSLSGAGLALRQSWWCFPMSLALFPVYSLAVLGTHATTPSWWPMVRLDGLANQPSAALVIGGFLLSNVSYFASGLYLLDMIPRRGGAKVASGGRGRGGLGLYSRLSAYPLLGSVVLACGFVSLVYHTVQAIGPHHAAEALFYVDHGLAISSFFYFLAQCGLPSRKTLLLGTAGITLLAAPAGEAYAFLHSIWHFVSAGATVSWANDGVERRKQFIISACRERRSAIGEKRTLR